MRLKIEMTARPATDEDVDEIRAYVSEYCALFGKDEKELMDSPFTVVTPDGKNPYKRLYVPN